MRYGLIGERLGHSHSPRLHALLGDESYALTPIARDALNAFMLAGDFAGVNVTIPYKRAVIPYCAELSQTARQVGSVNTVVKRADGTLYGDNTDAFGFAKMAERAKISFREHKTLVLGSGGTSLTACYVIREAGGEAVVISRSGEINYSQMDQHLDAQIIVNATPVGMYPSVDDSPVDLSRFHSLIGVMDVVYNPMRTRLLQQAAQLGIPHVGGLTMLVWQAVRAREIFDGRSIDPEMAAKVEDVLRHDVNNLVLVGMPGCGKTTVGKLCAKALGLQFVDIDAEIVHRVGKPIPQIFSEDGEAVFRALESEMIQACGKRSGQVLATGGGATLREENRMNLRMNSVVVRLTRRLENLSMQGRPLSQGLEALRKMEIARTPLYETCADLTVANDSTVAECVQKVLEGFHEAIRD